MKTRHAPEGAPISQERYLSSPEYAELRGISGPAVTAKACLMGTREKRSLLYFLQAMSLRPGGLKEFCREFLTMFADRIGTKTMHSLKVKDEHLYQADITEKIYREIYSADEDYPNAIYLMLDNLTKKTRTECLEKCREKLAGLEGFIIELCINPKLYFAGPGETTESKNLEQALVEDRFKSGPDDYQLGIKTPTYETSDLPYFKDIIGALFEYRHRHNEAIRREFVMTEVGKTVFEALDFGLQPSRSGSSKIVVLEGDSRIGKTTAGEAWCKMHLGEARFISLSGITSKTVFFRAVGKVLGIGALLSRSSTELQSRVEEQLQRSRLMLVIDEAHHIFSAAERVYSRPDLVDWINTALFNHGVPCGMLCTEQFRIRLARAEKQTTWNAAQLKGRIKRFPTLPCRPTLADLEAVARKLLPGVCGNTLKLVTGYALGCKLPFPGLVDSIDEAYRLAEIGGRQRVLFEDMDKAISQYTSQSALALAKAFDIEPFPQRRKRHAMPLPQPSKGNAAVVPLGRKTNLTGLAPARRETQPLVEILDDP